MKNIKYYLVIGLSAVFTACTDLLDIEPNNKITPNELFNNPNGAKAFMATIYRDLPIEDYMFMPGTSGEGGFNNPTGNIGLLWYANICEEAVQSQWGEQSPGYVIRADYFNHGYETLRNINLLKSIIPTLDIRDSEKKELEGEAAFMTAYVYFYLAEKFGGVPLIKELQEYDPANPGALVVPRSTEYDTWDYVMRQCDLAAALSDLLWIVHTFSLSADRCLGNYNNHMGNQMGGIGFKISCRFVCCFYCQIRRTGADGRRGCDKRLGRNET